MNLWDWAAPQLPAGTQAIDITEVLRFFYESEKQMWDLRDDFPNIAPPFEHFFLFGRTPSSAFIDGVWLRANTPDGAELGLSFDAMRCSDKTWAVSARVCGGVSGNAKWQDFVLLYRVSSEGKFMAMSDDAEAQGRGLGAVFPKSSQNIPRWQDLQTIISPFLLAICFMHCKNVAVRRVGPSQALARRCEKRGRPRFTYGILDIMPMKTVLEKEGGLIPGESLPKALHICRGHFKDYRDGRGLFGQHKGLFWWEQSVRGSPDVGVHDKLYRIH